MTLHSGGTNTSSQWLTGYVLLHVSGIASFKSNQKLPTTAAYVGGGLAATGVAVVGCTAFVCCHRRRKKRNEKKSIRNLKLEAKSPVSLRSNRSVKSLANKSVPKSIITHKTHKTYGGGGGGGGYKSLKSEWSRNSNKALKATPKGTPRGSHKSNKKPPKSKSSKGSFKGSKSSKRFSKSRKI